MSFTLKVKQSDLSRITNRLTKIVNELQSPSGPVLKYKIYILDSYREAIVSAIGSVEMSGGIAEIRFSALESSSTASWHALSPFTQTLKAYTGQKLAIWEASGEVKRSVGSPSHLMYNDFAGIDGTKTREAFDKALSVEFGSTIGGTEGFGGNQPPRALFTIANQIFKEKKDEIIKQIQNRIKLTITKSGWGT